jgi:hypothetical protein
MAKKTKNKKTIYGSLSEFLHWGPVNNHGKDKEITRKTTIENQLWKNQLLHGKTIPDPTAYI